MIEEDSKHIVQEGHEPKSDEIETSINSDHKVTNLDSDLKTPVNIADDFQANPFKDLQSNDNELSENFENTINNNENIKEDCEMNLKIKKELKVPHLFQTKPLKEVMKQVQKLSDYQSEAKQRLHEKQLEYASEELKTLRAKPEISKISKQMMQKKEYVPLYKRTEEILNKKKAKLEEERKKKQDIKEAEEKSLTFKPELCKKPGNFKNFVEFEEYMKHWNKTKQENIAKKQFINLEKEVENHPFKPEINEKSKKILQKKGHSQDKKVEIRLLESVEKEKLRKIQELEKNKPNFKPFLNPKTDKIVKDRRNKTNYLVEFLHSPENMENLNIQITSQGVEVFIKDPPNNDL